MRKSMTGLGAALMVLATAPAFACGGVGYACGHGEVLAFEHLPEPAGPRYPAGPQYYYVNQGPTYTGPGMYAPLPAYQDRAVNGWHGYEHGYYYTYDGGPYGDATSHYYDGMPNVRGPMVYHYGARKIYRYGSSQGIKPHIVYAD